MKSSQFYGLCFVISMCTDSPGVFLFVITVAVLDFAISLWLEDRKEKLSKGDTTP